MQLINLHNYLQCSGIKEEPFLPFDYMIILKDVKRRETAFCTNWSLVIPEALTFTYNELQ